MISDLLQAEAPEEVIKSIIRPEIEEGQMLQKKKMWMEMEGGVIASKQIYISSYIKPIVLYVYSETSFTPSL